MELCCPGDHGLNICLPTGSSEFISCFALVYFACMCSFCFAYISNPQVFSLSPFRFCPLSLCRSSEWLSGAQLPAEVKPWQGRKHQKLLKTQLLAVCAHSDPAKHLSTCSTQCTGMSSLTLLGQVCQVCNSIQGKALHTAVLKCFPVIIQFLTFSWL